jgi:hypothetical protein
MQLKEIISWSSTASSKAEKIQSSFKPMLARGQHRFDRCYCFFWQLFLQRLYWTCCLYKRPQWFSFSSFDSPDIKYTLLRFESNKENISSSCQVIKIQVEAKRLSWDIHSWCSILLKWKLCLVTLGDWQHLAGLDDRGHSEIAVVIVDAWRRSWWPCTWFELHHVGDGKQRLLVSAYYLCDMGGDITLCGWYNVD